MAQIPLEQARELVGWTQSRLAREAGEHVSNIRDLENGVNSNPNYALVMRVTTALRRAGLTALNPEDMFPVTEKEKKLA